MKLNITDRLWLFVATLSAIAATYALKAQKSDSFASRLMFRAVSALGSVLAVVVAAVAIVVGLFVIGTLQTSLNTSGLTSQAQTGIGNVFGTTYNAFQLLVIVIIVIAAVAILAVLIGGLAGGRRGE